MTVFIVSITGSVKDSIAITQLHSDIAAREEGQGAAVCLAIPVLHDRLHPTRLVEGPAHAVQHRVAVVLPAERNVMLLGLQLSSDELLVEHLPAAVVIRQDTVIRSLVGTGDTLPAAVVEDSTMRNVGT